MSQERHRFYVGVKDCGCITATLVDDSITKPKEIADFAREMQKTNRRVEHREMTLDEFKDVFKRCKCEPSNALSSAAAVGGRLRRMVSAFFWPALLSMNILPC